LGLQYIYTWNYHKETQSSYLYLKQQKYHCFLFIFSLFPLHKLENRRVEQVLPREGDWESGIGSRGKVAGKAGKRVNMVQKMCYM
jgi:hypothetical protein